MKTVMKIIEVLRGDLNGLRQEHIRLEIPSFMPLSIEWIGHGPREWPMISVMHFFEQNGDLMRDPDVEFEVPPVGAWTPLTYTQHSIGLYQQAMWADDNGVVKVDTKLLRDLRKFTKQWDQNLLEQGFVAEAQRIAKG